MGVPSFDHSKLAHGSHIVEVHHFHAKISTHTCLFPRFFLLVALLFQVFFFFCFLMNMFRVWLSAGSYLCWSNPFQLARYEFCAFLGCGQLKSCRIWVFFPVAASCFFMCLKHNSVLVYTWLRLEWGKTLLLGWVEIRTIHIFVSIWIIIFFWLLFFCTITCFLSSCGYIKDSFIGRIVFVWEQSVRGLCFFLFVGRALKKLLNLGVSYVKSWGFFVFLGIGMF